jgi:hypothetical protein
MVVIIAFVVLVVLVVLVVAVTPADDGVGGDETDLRITVDIKAALEKFFITKPKTMVNMSRVLLIE